MGLERLVPASEALETVLAHVSPTPTEHVGLAEAGGRVLARDLAALRTQPPFDASAMDGYAVRSADISSLPTALELTGESRAGTPYDGTVGPGQAVRIFTGAVVPDGADTIIIQENTRAESARVIVEAGTPPGKFIRRAGLDFREGETLLCSGDVLTANRLALAASMNHATLPVFRRPRVAMIASGDELVLPGDALKPGQIIASNTFGLAAAIAACGGETMDLGIIGDTREALLAAFDQAVTNGADLIITTGGASVGDHDLVMPAAKDAGFEFEIAKIAMRPGKPFLFARREEKGRVVTLTGLAGNPVSSLVAFHVFVKPLIHLLSGRSPETVRHVRARLGRDLGENDERAEYMRATLEQGPDGEWIATPFENQDSSMLARLVSADCLVYRPVRAPAAHTGEPCEIVLLD